ncbi:hypothetical protein [Austwickia sp. TVS 96-490-7B]|uniref:hypothetical protein n=1 Tax=Austwickia sp. TVS 96-490-7B TaxID=2830843 RepID=UPI001C57C22B|nr:hypothetical protein [Austwickia sp. TVS 96-490-7B]
MAKPRSGQHHLPTIGLHRAADVHRLWNADAADPLTAHSSDLRRVFDSTHIPGATTY